MKKSTKKINKNLLMTSLLFGTAAISTTAAIALQYSNQLPSNNSLKQKSLSTKVVDAKTLPPIVDNNGENNITNSSIIYKWEYKNFGDADVTTISDYKNYYKNTVAHFNQLDGTGSQSYNDMSNFLKLIYDGDGTSESGTDTLLFYEDMKNMIFNDFPDFWNSYFKKPYEEKLKEVQNQVPKVEKWLKDISGMVSETNTSSKSISINGSEVSTYNLYSGTLSPIDYSSNGFKAGYTTYVKIAELDLNKIGESDIIFNFTPEEFTNNGYGESIDLVIKNSYLKSLASGFVKPTASDVFARWSLDSSTNYLEPSADYDSNYFHKLEKTFVFYKTSSGQIGVDIALKNAQVIKGLKFSDLTPNGSGAVIAFGILDVYEDPTLIPYNSAIDNTVNEIPVFSNFISFDYNDAPTSSDSFSAEGNLSYVFNTNNELSFNLNSYYQDKIGTFKAIFQVSNGLPIGTPLSLDFGYNGGMISPTNGIQIYDDFKTDASAWEDGSHLNEYDIKNNLYKSDIFTTNAIAKQEIIFNPNFMQLTNNKATIFDYDASTKPFSESFGLEYLSLDLLTQPIFWEKDPAWESTPTFSNSATESAHLVASEPKNNKTIVKSLFENIYSDWKGGDNPDLYNDLAFVPSTDRSISYISYDDNFKSIEINQKATTLNDIDILNINNNSGSGLYNASKLYYDDIMKIIKNLMPDIDSTGFTNQFDVNKFDNDNFDSEWLLNSSYTDADAIVEEINNAITDLDMLPENPNDSAYKEAKKTAAPYLAKYVVDAFSNVNAKFMDQVKLYFVETIENFVKDTNTYSRKTINLDVIKFDTTKNMFYFDGDKSLVDKDITNKDWIKNLLDFIYKGNGSNIAIGRSIFVGNPSFNSVDDYDLLTAFNNEDQRNAYLLFEASLPTGQPEKINSIFDFYNKVFSSFGNPSKIIENSFSFNSIINKSLKEGLAFDLSWEINGEEGNESYSATGLEDVFTHIFDLLDVNKNQFYFKDSSTGQKTSTSYFKVIIGAANAYALLDELKASPSSIKSDLSESDKEIIYNSSVIDNFKDGNNLYRLYKGYQKYGTPKYDTSLFAEFIDDLSTEAGTKKIKESTNWGVFTYTSDNDEKISPNLNLAMEMVKQISPILIALISVGILVASSMLIVKGSKSQTAVVKSFLIALIIISLIALVMAGVAIPMVF